MDGFLWALQFPSPITPHKEEIRSFESKKKSRPGNTMLKGIRINNYRQKHYTEN
jgi:hypothetical protein